MDDKSKRRHENEQNVTGLNALGEFDQLEVMPTLDF